jgi:streptomycin 6-kinase
MNNFQENIRNIYGELGKKWLSNLPSLVQELSSLYGLSHLRPCANLSFNYVLEGFQEQKPIVLKLGLDDLALKREAEALRVFSRKGVVNILFQKEGMLLIEPAVPGLSLKHFFPKRDVEAIKIASTCMKQLHQANIPQNHNFLHIQDWLQVLVDLLPVFKNEDSQLREVLAADDQCRSLHKLSP